MRMVMPVVSMLTMTLLGGCGSPMAGVYLPKAYLHEGKEASDNPRYTPEAIQQRFEDENRVMTLNPDWTFSITYSGGSREGTYRVEGQTLILRDTHSNGAYIQPALQDDRHMEIQGNNIAEPNAYHSYNAGVVYEKQ